MVTVDGYSDAIIHEWWPLYMLLSCEGNNNNNNEHTLILRYSIVSATARTIVRNCASRRLQDIIIKAIVTLRPFPAATVNNGFPLKCFLT